MKNIVLTCAQFLIFVELWVLDMQKVVNRFDGVQLRVSIYLICKIVTLHQNPTFFDAE